MFVTYLIKLCKEQSELKREQEEIQEFLELRLKQDYKTLDTGLLKKLVEDKLTEMFDSKDNFNVSVDSMWWSDTPSKVSYFINLKMKSKEMKMMKSVIVFAEFKELTSLRDAAAYQASKHLERLPAFLPKTLQADIDKFL